MADPLTDVRGLEREKRILDSCFRRNEQAGLHHYAAGVVGKLTLLLVAAVK